MLELLQNYASLFIYPVIALFLSALLTWAAIRILPRLGYIDNPGGRHIHEHIVPRGGGIAVILAFFIALGLYAIETQTPGAGKLFWRLFVPALLLGSLGMVDDRYELKSWIKLGVQLIVVVIVWLTSDHNYIILGWTMPWFVSLGLTAVWIIVILNAFNLIDGLDGLASGLAIVSSGCLAIWFLMVSDHRPETVTMLILAASCLGFLRYNFHPAKIFLGDTGSTFLGLIFAIIGLSTIDRAVTVTSLLLPMLAIGVPLFDVVLAIWRRSMRKLLDPAAGGIMDGDQDHLHHRLLRQTKKQTTTAISMYLLACAFAGAALVIIAFRDSAPAVTFIILLIAVLIVIRQLAVVELFDSARVIQHGMAKPRRGILVNIVHPFIDFGVICGSFVVTCYLILGEITDFNLFVFAFAPVALLLCVSKVYRVYWLRAGLSNYWHLALMVLLGSLLACALIYIFCYPQMRVEYGIDGRNFISGCLIFTMLNLLAIATERFLVHYAEGFWFRKLYLQCQQERPQRILVYGGGLKCRVYANYLYCIQRKEIQEEIIGIIDDDTSLHGLQLYGFHVLGSVADVDAIYMDHPFDKILITAFECLPESESILQEFCKARNIPLVRLEFSIQSCIKTDP